MKLKKFRKEKSISPEEMAEILEISVSHYYKIEEGYKKPSFKLMERFKKQFKEVQIDDVFFK